MLKDKEECFLQYFKLPSWIKYRRETDTSISILNVKTNKMFIIKDPLGISLDVLSLLSKDKFTLKEVYSELNVFDQTKRAYIKMLYYEVFETITEKNNESTKRFYSENNLNHSPYLSSPISLELLITYKCNAKCSHCLVGDLRYSKEADMPLDLIKKIARDTKKYNLYSMAISGGEPFARKDFFEIMDVIRNENKDIQIELVTNGIELTENKVKRLNKYNISRYIISLEGAKESTHDRIRGKGSFNKVIKGIKNLKKYSEANGVEVKITCGKHNINELEKLAEFCTDLGVNSLEIGRLNPWGWGKFLSKYILTDDNLVELDRKIKKLNARYENLSIHGYAVSGPLRNGCNIGGAFAVQPNGIVLPCRIFEQRVTEDIILGDLSKQDILEIWEAKRFKQARDLVANIGEYFNECKACSYFNICSYPHCIARAYIIADKKDLINATETWQCPGEPS